MLQYSFLRQFRLIKCSFFIHSTTPYVHPKLDSQIEPKFPIGWELVLSNVEAPMTHSWPHLTYIQAGMSNRNYLPVVIECSQTDYVDTILRRCRGPSQIYIFYIYSPFVIQLKSCSVQIVRSRDSYTVGNSIPEATTISITK